METNMKKKLSFLLCLALTTLLVACANTTKQKDANDKTLTDTKTDTNTDNLADNEADTTTETPSESVTKKGKIILATTTSTQDSGLLDKILPIFTSETGWEVDTIAVGTGEALAMGEKGEADVLLVHAKAKEEAFIEAGNGIKRFDVMYNDFVIVGPTGNIAKNEDVKTTFQSIFDNKYAFVSRGDESGTHTKELAIWGSLNITPQDNANYISAGQGMGATILMAEEKKAYTLSDRATWLTTKAKTTMDIICEKDTQLLNYYGVIAVNPKLNELINAEGAQAFVDWILSENTQKVISEFGVEEYGEPLFIPNATANK